MTFEEEIKEAAFECEKILNDINELRNAILKKQEIESELVEVALNQNVDESLEKALEKQEQKVAALENDIKSTLTRLSERLEMIKESYEVIANKYGGFRKQ